MKKQALTAILAAIMAAVAAHPLAAQNDIASSRKNAITRAVARCSPAIVGINVTETRQQYYSDPFADFFGDPFFRNYWGDRPRTYRKDYEVRSLGSGFLISEDGYILTNDHVAGNATKIVVTMTDGSKHDAKIVGTDPVTDVALLKIEGKKFPFVKLASSEDVEVGEWAIAFGNPFGLFDNNAKPTVTVGVVSNVGVSFTQPNGTGGRRVYRNMIQTDAAISSGNSGGPLINGLGEVIGVNTVIYSTSQGSNGAGSIGIGFAIPINRVKAIVDRLRDQGTIRRDFWTGMTVTPVNAEIAAYYRLNAADGVLVTEVASNGPADEAGIEPGDVIIAVDGQPTLREDDINIAILDGEVNQRISVEVRRGGQTSTVTMTLKARPRSGGVRN
jgi:serine protease Do